MMLRSSLTLACLSVILLACGCGSDNPAGPPTGGQPATDSTSKQEPKAPAIEAALLSFFDAATTGDPAAIRKWLVSHEADTMGDGKLKKMPTSDFGQWKELVVIYSSHHDEKKGKVLFTLEEKKPDGSLKIHEVAVAAMRMEDGNWKFDPGYSFGRGDMDYFDRVGFQDATKSAEMFFKVFCSGKLIRHLKPLFYSDDQRQIASQSFDILYPDIKNRPAFELEPAMEDGDVAEVKYNFVWDGKAGRTMKLIFDRHVDEGWFINAKQSILGEQSLVEFGVQIESETARMLKAIHRAQGQIRENDLDGNGLMDWWTADLATISTFDTSNMIASGGVIGEDGKMIIIAPGVVRADARPLDPSIGQNLGGGIPFRGFWYRMMAKDSNGDAYATDPDGDGTSSTNQTGWAAAALPPYRELGGTPMHMLIINETGQVWRKPSDGSLPDQWPGPDPSANGWTLVK